MHTGPTNSARPLTRTIINHLRVLRAGLVRGVRRECENLFELRRGQFDTARRALHRIARQWDQTLAQLKAFVEE